jgi:hypothetical protein
MKNTMLWLKIHILCIISTIISQVSLFWGRLFPERSIGLAVSLFASGLFLMVQLFFMIPYIQLGMTVMSPVQLVLLAVGWTFLIQLIINEAVWKSSNTMDDYIGVICVFLGIVISKFRIFS